MASFNISGDCTLRDAFGFKEDCRHEVKQFLQFSSPITWFDFKSQPGQNISFEQLDKLKVDWVSWKSNFYKKCIITDYNRQALNYFSEKTDFFIIDFTELVNLSLIRQTLPDGRIHYFTSSFGSKYKNENGVSFLDILPGTKEELEPETYLNDERLRLVADGMYDYLVNRLGYEEKQIILACVYDSTDYFDQGKHNEYGIKNKLLYANAQLEKIYDYFEFICPGAKVIRMPEEVFGELPHKWGFHCLHFCREAYDYLYECFDRISDGTFDGCRENLLNEYRVKIGLARRDLNRYGHRIDRSNLQKICLKLPALDETGLISNCLDATAEQNCESETSNRFEALILTNSDQIEGLEELIKSLPELVFHIGANTGMSERLTSLLNYENVRLYPGMSHEKMQELLKSCSFYLDINYGGEIRDIVHRAYDRDVLIIGFKDTLHEPRCVLDEMQLDAGNVEKMIEILRILMKYENTRIEKLKAQEWLLHFK